MVLIGFSNYKKIFLKFNDFFRGINFEKMFRYGLQVNEDYINGSGWIVVGFVDAIFHDFQFFRFGSGFALVTLYLKIFATLHLS